MHARAAKRVHTQGYARCADGVHINDMLEVLHIGGQEVVPMGRGGR